MGRPRKPKKNAESETKSQQGSSIENTKQALAVKNDGKKAKTSDFPKKKRFSCTVCKNIV